MESEETAGETGEPVYTYTDTVVAPTCTQQGYTRHECNEDPSRSYDDSYTDPLGHDFQNGACTRCGEADPNYVAPTPTPEPTPTEPPAESTAPPPAEPTEESPAAPASEEEPAATE